MVIHDITDDLPVHPTRKYNRRYISRIESIVLHHSGGVGSPESFANYHISKGWPGIGYHYVINKEGTIYQTNRIDTISYNVGPENPRVVSICVIGNYDNKLLSFTQKESILDLVNLLRVLLGNKPVKGHKEFKATDCPGKDIMEFIKTLNK